MQESPASSDHEYVVRLDGPRHKGWQLRMPPWRLSGPASKYFADSKYGSKDAALSAALAERDERMGPRPEPGEVRFHRSNTRNSSRLVGVSIDIEQRRPTSSGANLAWIAYWSDQGQQRRKRFTVSRYGFVNAWERAVAMREQMTGRPFPEHELVAGRLRCLELWSELKGG